MRIDSTNVAAMTARSAATLRGSAEKLRVVWNGQTDQGLNAARAASWLGAGDCQAARTRRTRRPLPAVIATPFAVVVGTTSSDPRMRETIQARADFFAQQWLTWQHQPLRMLKDTEVTAEHEKAYSLVLIGGRTQTRSRASSRDNCRSKRRATRFASMDGRGK